MEKNKSLNNIPSIGIDIGSLNLHVSILDNSKQRFCWVRPLKGKALATLADLVETEIRPLLGETQVRLGVTGQGRDQLDGLVPFEPMNEVVATAEAIKQYYPQAKTVIDFGGQFAKWIELTDSKEIGNFATNGLCAAGSGAFLEQQASRLQITVEELGNQAVNAETAASIAGRCSVFAKSDMIHHQQKGTPTEAICYGLCLALARTFFASVLEGRSLKAPVVLVGGGAANPGLVRAFKEVSNLKDEDVLVPEDPRVIGAIGACTGASADTSISLEALSKIGSSSKRVLEKRVATTFAPLPEIAPNDDHEVTTEATGDTVHCFIGVDVGSVSTNFVLINPANEVLLAIYLRTRGRPVEAIAEGLEQVHEKFGDSLHVLGVGVTGSGRHLADEVLGSDVVRNEITAQLVSTAHYFPNVDTIFEIGGQDSKYIGTRQGNLSGFEMNKICAAGTGSFLEEQAEGLDVSIIDEFADLALQSKKPSDLGSRCTVFMDAEMRRAMQQDASISDICAGLSYSVARNYLDKVVAGRPVGNEIVFQGGTASNRAVVSAMTAILGKPITVHPYNRVSGAIGMAHLAAKEKEERPYETRFRGLDACQNVGASTFECRSCTNRCQVNKIEIGDRNVHFGDICEKFTQKDSIKAPVHRPFPELFAQRALAFEHHCEIHSAVKASKDAKFVHLPRASVLVEHGPFMSAWLSKLGFVPLISKRSTNRVVQRGAEGLPPEVCLPIKIAAGQVKSILENDPKAAVLVPSFTELPSQDKQQSEFCCPYTQELPHMLPQDLEKLIISPQFSLGDTGGEQVEAARTLANSLKVNPAISGAALLHAKGAHKRFMTDLTDQGRHALDQDFDRAVVVLGRPYNVHDRISNLNLPLHLDRLGMWGIPFDMLPIDDIELDPRWDRISWHYPRRILRALELIQNDKRLFPLVVSSFGCGLDGFLFKHLEELLSDRPHLLLEFDEHRAEAGLVTRLEAFSDEIEDHLRSTENKYTPISTPPSPHKPLGRRVFVPNMGHMDRAYSGVLRAAGYETVVLDPPTEKTAQVGEAISSGKECHPYSVLGGQILEAVDTYETRKDDVFLSLCCDVSCLLKQYGDSYRIGLRRLGITDMEVWDVTNTVMGKIIGTSGMSQFFTGLTIIELLSVLARRVRPYCENPEEPLERFRELAIEIETAIANRKPLKPILSKGSRELWDMPTLGRPGDRPVVGVTGDLYTRIVDSSNGYLFDRLEQQGLEVWPSPHLTPSSPLSDGRSATRAIVRFNLKDAANFTFKSTVSQVFYNKLVAELPEAVIPLVAEPPALKMRELAKPYTGPNSNWLIALCLGKLTDFINRGATGAISVVGINCMVGTAVSSVIPKLRADLDNAPIINVAYGGGEGPGQKIRLETFAHQVFERHSKSQ